MQSITVWKTSPVRTFVQKRNIDTHKIRVHGPLEKLSRPKNLIKLDHIFCTLIWYCLIWMKNLHIWLKLVDIASGRWWKGTNDLYFSHLFQRSKKIEVEIDANFSNLKFHVYCKYWSLFQRIWWLLEKIILTVKFFCRQSGLVPGFRKLWCMDELEWTMLINLNQRTLDVIVSIIFNYYLFCLTFKKWINAMRQQ